MCAETQTPTQTQNVAAGANMKFRDFMREHADKYEDLLDFAWYALSYDADYEITNVKREELNDKVKYIITCKVTYTVSIDTDVYKDTVTDTIERDYEFVLSKEADERVNVVRLLEKYADDAFRYFNNLFELDYYFDDAEKDYVYDKTLKEVFEDYVFMVEENADMCDGIAYTVEETISCVEDEIKQENE